MTTTTRTMTTTTTSSSSTPDYPPSPTETEEEDLASDSKSSFKNTVFGKVFDADSQILKLFPSLSSKGNDDYSVVTSTNEPKRPFLLLMSDFCPFANRVWIALLEHEQDVTNPQLFDAQHVCYQLGPVKDIGTKMLYSIHQNTVPVLIDNSNGNIYGESMALVEYIDDIFSVGNQKVLQPTDATMRYNMKIFMDRYTSMVPLFYKLLTSQIPKDQYQLADDLRRLLIQLDDDLTLFQDGGPYMCGTKFTYADIQIFPFVERIMVCLLEYQGFELPTVKYPNLYRWYKACSDRPSIRTVTSDRSETSMNTYCFEKKNRHEYLNEVYECYAYDEVEYAKQLTIEKGLRGVNVYLDPIQRQEREQQQQQEATMNNTTTASNDKKRKEPPTTS